MTASPPTPIRPEGVLYSIYLAVDEFNSILPPERPLSKSPDTALIGEGGSLESIELVNLVLAVEQRIDEDHGVSISLADDRAMAQTRSPFRPLGTLAEYAEGLIREQRRPSE